MVKNIQKEDNKSTQIKYSMYVGTWKKHVCKRKKKKLFLIHITLFCEILLALPLIETYPLSYLYT